MQQIVPLIVVCAVGLAICLALLMRMLWRYLKNKFRFKHKEEFDLDDTTLTVKLNKKDIR